MSRTKNASTVCRFATASFAALSAFALSPAEAVAQCAVPQTYVAQSPVVQAPVVQAPVVYQQTTVNDRWYPGKNLANFSRNLFGGSNTTTTYTAGYAPVSGAYTANYSPYTVGYAPLRVGQTSYRPTYPITYGPVVQTVSRPVVLSPVVPATSCNACCGGVSQATYAAPLSSGCSNCTSGPAYYSSPAPSTSTISPASPSGGYTDPAPTLAPNENPAPQRSLKPSDDGLDTLLPEDDAASDDSGAYWQAPPLFDPKDRLTSRSAAPVHRAVYRQPVSSQAPAKVNHQVGASGWVSAN